MGSEDHGQLPTPPEFVAHLYKSLTALVDTVRSPEPFMVNRAEAARRCDMSVATYDKYARQGKLPAVNAVGKISIEALKRACMKLDGLAETEAASDPAERALREFEKRKSRQ